MKYVFTCFIKKFEFFTEYSILNRLEVGVFDRLVRLESPYTVVTTLKRR
jgi:hypothetical protein